ncbi:hypothetical protein NA57DRAFT_68068 [Rhizodiscina lignyota]|uniref:Cardiolipin synthase n=1 Tax=Rhizodiscina lignyota TaxID=1504668 RepID=A0A9P4I4W2_9PEZI|nr:hypothetical protein NA57DRAFT_68068 [Rhizodiscina lignyota]
MSHSDLYRKRIFCASSKNSISNCAILQLYTPIRDRVISSISKLTPHENIYTVPNLLTFSRLLATPVIGYLILHDQHAWAIGLFAYAGISDLVDGWMARRWNLQTVVGSVIDPMADKFLMITLIGCLAFKGALPLSLATIILGRDISLGIAAIYYRWASLPAPKTFMRYWDFSLPSAEVHPTTVSKYNTFLQLVLVGATTTLPVAPPVILGLDVNRAVTAMQYIVAATTVWSGASYTWRKDVVKILGEDEALKKKQGARGRFIIALSFAGFVALAAWFATSKEEAKEGGDTSQAPKQ